ncbi:MAG: hypothetical protein FJW88_08650 [Actinobacteria bacterium]|nr:hypothetical protein [Actinomycetota bacterium]
MTVDRTELCRELSANLPDAAVRGIDGPVVVGPLVRAWLDGHDAALARDELDALCRQIDVRKRVSAEYGPGWKAVDPEVAAPPAVVAALVAALLLAAQRAVASGDGWALKLVNSALKALDLAPDAPRGPALRAWAVDLLDATAGWGPT